MSKRTSHAYAAAGQANPPHIEMEGEGPNDPQSRQSIKDRETMPKGDYEIKRVYEKVEETEKKILAEFAQQTKDHMTMQQDVVRVIGSTIREGIHTELKHVEENKRQYEDFMKKKDDELHRECEQRDREWENFMKKNQDELKRVQWQLRQANSDHEREKSTYVSAYHQCREEIESLKAELRSKSESEATAIATTQRSQQRIQQLEHDLAMVRQDLQRSHRQQESTRQQGIASQQPDHTPGWHNAEEMGIMSYFPWTGSSKGKTVKVAEVREMEKQWRAEIEKKKSDLEKMQTELVKRNAELENANRTIRIKEDKITRLTGKLLDDTHKSGGDAANRYTHSGLLHEYEALYTVTKQQTKRALERIGTQYQAQCDEVLSQIFPVAYDECKDAALQMLFKDLYRPHKDGEDTKSAGQQARIYGQLLQLSPNLPLPLIAISAKIKGNILKLRTKAKEYSISEVEDYLKESVKLAWKMVTINPPMIVDQPAEFDEDLHERVFREWKDTSNSFELVYRRPVLYNSYRDSIPASKARVGNKCKEPDEYHEKIESEL